MSKILISLALSMACLSPFAQAVAFDVRKFGATVNDGTDDRAAIQAAIDAACVEVAAGTLDVSIYFAPGVFDLFKGPEPAPDEPWVILSLGCGGFTMLSDPVSEPGGQSTLRVADGQGAYEALLGAPSFAQRIDGFTIRDLTFNGNGTNNPILAGDDEFDDLLREKRHALRVYAGDDVVIEMSRFTDWRTVNVLTLNGVDVANATILGNRFDLLGQTPATGPDWDHSTIYTDCDGALIEDNVIIGRAPGNFGIRAGIETHGPDQTVSKNLIFSMTTGINATGVSVLGSDGLLIESNRIVLAADGIRLWAFEVAGNVPGEPVLRNAVIRDNRIEMHTTAWRTTQDAFDQPNRGISLVGDSDGVIENLTIENNTIVFDDYRDTRVYDRGSAGIRLVPDIVTDLPIDGLTISDNTIQDALATAIEVGSTLPDGAIIQNNRIINAGLGSGGTVPALNKSALSIFGEYTDVDVLDTCIIDDEPSGPRLAQAFLLQATSLGGNRLLDTDIELAGGSLTTILTIEPLGAPWLVGFAGSSCPSLFSDGFEIGDFSNWSSATLPGG